MADIKDLSNKMRSSLSHWWLKLPVVGTPSSLERLESSNAILSIFNVPRCVTLSWRYSFKRRRKSEMCFWRSTHSQIEFSFTHSPVDQIEGNEAPPSRVAIPQGFDSNKNRSGVKASGLVTICHNPQYLTLDQSWSCCALGSLAWQTNSEVCEFAMESPIA